MLEETIPNNPRLENSAPLGAFNLRIELVMLVGNVKYGLCQENRINKCLKKGFSLTLYWLGHGVLVLNFLGFCTVCCGI